jgi:hypothetical protein
MTTAWTHHGAGVVAFVYRSAHVVTTIIIIIIGTLHGQHLHVCAHHCRGPAGAGLIGPANPEGANWKVFQEAAAPASWRLLLPTAGHTTFSSPQATWERWLLDKCFGGGERQVEHESTKKCMYEHVLLCPC